MRLRLLAALAASLCSTAALADGACQMSKIGHAALRYSTPSLQVTVDGNINGKTLPFLFDTGASVTVINKSMAEQLGLPLKATDQRVYGVGGRAYMYKVKLDSFAVGDARPAHNQVFSILDDFGAAPRLAGIFGMDVMSQADVELNLPDKQANFYAVRGCGQTHLAYWDANAIVLPMVGKSDTSMKGLIEIEVNGQRIQALLDTGAGATVIDRRAAERVGIRADMPGAQPAGFDHGIGEDRKQGWLVPVASVKLGDEELRDLQIRMTDMDLFPGENRVEMLLGADFLRAHRVLIANSQRQVYISYRGGDPVAADERARSAFIAQEVKAGNPDALYLTSLIRYHRSKNPADKRAALSLIEQAAAQGVPEAHMVAGHAAFLDGDWDKSAQQLTGYTGFAPAEPYPHLLQVLAYLRLHQKEQAQQHLLSLRQHYKGERWPLPVIRHLQGEISQAELLDMAVANTKFGELNSCYAQMVIGELALSQNQSDKARQALASAHASCKPGYPGADIAAAELARLPAAPSAP